ncbi:hypothetical protein LTS18_004226 [Coniosporium uncinatum]|uniref:Uncharacterized protein n=1 Tax=Coniosporium uncinatum TaxID=93489 RepID=A0ACC3D5U4_9PEZI|nr:hypothetical protein LTS18_004226 [Coniosporium uncinatum]
MAWWEIKRWRRLQERTNNISKEAVDPMDAVYMASRPYTSQAGIWLGSKAHSYRHRTLLRWFVAYTTSVPALFILSLALAGLFACLCQYILLRSIEKEVPSLTAQVGAFAEKVVFAVNNASMAWANGTNSLIINENTKINDDLFGWVNSSTTALNDTLNAFVDKTTEVINATFGGTILQEPIQGVFDCLIGLKVQGIESALTWVHDNAHVGFPLLDNQTFTLKNLASHTNSSSDDSFLASPNSETQDNISEAVTSLIGAIKRGIRQEAIISTVILLLWFVIILMGLARMGVLFFGHDKMRGEGGQDYPSNNNDRAFAAQDNAPPPQYNNPDVTGNGYTLNPHPFPPPASPSPFHEQSFTGTDEKRSHVGVRDLLNQITHPRQAHKSMHGAIINEKTV